MMAYSAKFRQLMEDAIGKQKQCQLAMKAEVSPGLISKIRTMGWIPDDLEAVRRLAEALDQDADTWELTARTERVKATLEREKLPQAGVDAAMEVIEAEIKAQY